MLMVASSGEITLKLDTRLVSVIIKICRYTYILSRYTNSLIVCTINIHCLSCRASSAVADCAAEGPNVIFSIITPYGQEVVISESHTILQTLSLLVRLGGYGCTISSPSDNADWPSTGDTG